MKKSWIYYLISGIVIVSLLLYLKFGTQSELVLDQKPNTSPPITFEPNISAPNSNTSKKDLPDTLKFNDNSELNQYSKNNFLVYQGIPNKYTFSKENEVETAKLFIFYYFDDSTQPSYKKNLELLATGDLIQKINEKDDGFTLMEKMLAGISDESPSIKIIDGKTEVSYSVYRFTQSYIEAQSSSKARLPIINKEIWRIRFDSDLEGNWKVSDFYIN